MIGCQPRDYVLSKNRHKRVPRFIGRASPKQEPRSVQSLRYRVALHSPTFARSASSLAVMENVE